MSINLVLNDEIKERRAHLLPCSVQADAGSVAAPVDRYFEPYITSNNNELKASFRGHELDGEKIKFPDNYQAIVLNEARRPISDKSDRKLYADGKFNEMTYWNWNKMTSKNDSIQRAMDWIDIAEALHSPIEMKD